MILFPVQYRRPSLQQPVSLGMLCLILGWRFYKSLKPVAQGIESLSLQKKTHLSERGILGELKEQINQTSAILEKQNELLSKRDDARTEWISGVSHDIRTPLSMIMGYADTLGQDKTLSEEQQYYQTAEHHNKGADRRSESHIKAGIPDAAASHGGMQPFRTSASIGGRLLQSESGREIYNRS